MSITIVCGAPGLGLHAVSQLLEGMGLAAPHAAQGKPDLTVRFIHDRLSEAQDTTAPHPIQPGRMWESITSDVLLANLDTPHWGWVDSRSTWLLDFWHDFEPSTRFILVHESPHAYLSRCLAYGMGNIAQTDLMTSWLAHERQLLHFHHRHRDRSLLVDRADLLSHPAAFQMACAEHLGLILHPTDAFSLEDLDDATQMDRLLVTLVLDDHPDIAAFNQEIISSLTPLSNEAGLEPEFETPIAAAIDDLLLTRELNAELSEELQQNLQALKQTRQTLEALDIQHQLMVNSLAKEQQARQTQANQHQQELRQLRQNLANQAQLSRQLDTLNREKTELSEESELLLLQLHQVQEELERYFLDNQTLKNSLTEREQENAELITARDQHAQLAAERQSQIEHLTQAHDAEAHAKAEAHARIAELSVKMQQFDTLNREKTELSEESELLLLQLHQVQEELERYFLECQSLKASLSERDQRWQRMLDRNPGYHEYGSLTLQDKKQHNRNLSATWEFKDLVAGERTLPSLTVTVRLHDGHPALIIHKPDDTSTPVPLFRWPSVANDLTTLDIQPEGPAATKAPRMAVLSSLSSPDWRLIETLTTVLLKQISHPGNAFNGQETKFLHQGITQLSKQLNDFPKIWRHGNIQLKKEERLPHYEHLWLTLDQAECQTKHWPSFEFRLGAADINPEGFSQHPRLEFPDLGENHAAFDQWFEESRDHYGPKLELRFDLNAGILDPNVWKKLTPRDQTQLYLLLAALPDMLATLKAQGQTIHRSWDDWQRLGKQMLTIVTQRLSQQAQPAQSTPPQQQRQKRI